MAFILGSFFVFAVVWATLGTIDIVVVAQGQTVPTGEVKTLQTLETGVVRAVHVADGNYVEKGDLLIEMDPTETVANLDALQAQWIQASVEAELGGARGYWGAKTPGQYAKHHKSQYQGTFDKPDKSSCSRAGSN